jgi:hypothetical protein
VSGARQFKLEILNLANQLCRQAFFERRFLLTLEKKLKDIWLSQNIPRLLYSHTPAEASERIFPCSAAPQRKSRSNNDVPICRRNSSSGHLALALSFS